MDDCEHFWVNISSKRQRAWQCSHCGELKLDDPAQKREWQGLTDKERNDCLVEADPCEALLDHEAHELMRTVEAKLKEKNA